MSEREECPSVFKHIQSFTAHSTFVSSIQFAPTHSKLLASASADTSIKLWDLHAKSEPTLKAFYKGHTSGISDISWSPTASYIASASDDHTVGLWDSDSEKNVTFLGQRQFFENVFASRMNAEYRREKGHSQPVLSVRFNPQGTLLASASFDETFRLWDLRTFTPIACVVAHQEPITSVSFSHDGTLLATASYDGLARVWDVASRQCLRTLILQRPPAPPRAIVSHVQFTKNSRYIFCSMLDQSIRLWDYRKGSDTIVRAYEGHVNTEYCIPCVHTKLGTKELVISGSEDHSVVLWDLQTEEIVQRLNDHSSPVLAVAYSEMDSLLASGAETTIRIWQT